MQFLRKIDELLFRLEFILLVFFLSSMVLLSFGQVVLRNLFNEGILWADIILRQWVLWVGFLGASLAVRESKHLSIDFLPLILPGRWKRYLKIIASSATGIISLFLAQAAWVFVEYEREAETLLVGDLPVWIFQLILPYSFLVIGIRFLFDAAGHLRNQPGGPS